jgi:translation elongation factor EF-G
MPSPKRLYNPKEKLISELKKSRDNLYNILKDIIENVNLSSSNKLKSNAKKSINSIEDLIEIIQKSTISEIKEIAETALRK